jgi:hypothetical protein
LSSRRTGRPPSKELLVKAAVVLVSLCLVLSLGALGLFFFSGTREAPIEHREASASTAEPALSSAEPSASVA